VSELYLEKIKSAGIWKRRNSENTIGMNIGIFHYVILDGAQKANHSREI
jgi:hypothetical protein